MADKQRKGRSSELSVAGQMLREGLDVYLPWVDDQGIDLVLRQERDDEVEYYDIQVKSVEGYNTPLGIPDPEQHTGAYILVVHYRHADREDEIIYLREDQIAEHRQDSDWAGLRLTREDRERYLEQDLGALAQAVQEGTIGPTAETEQGR